MNRITICIIILLIPSILFSQVKVLVLGSYHMENPGLDKFNMEADDVSSAKRQKEIEAFVNLLATFKPTKICVEAQLERHDKLNENYKAYLSNNFELQKNEIHQIGFRLAKKLGLKEVYAVDASAPFNMDTVIAVAQQDPSQYAELFELLQKMPAFMAEEQKKLRESTITQFYKHLNSRNYIRQAHEPYILMATVGKEKNYSGADLVADWYKRNLRIYRNIALIPHTTTDRFLVIYGSGHTKILQDLIRDSAGFELVELDQLK